MIKSVKGKSKKELHEICDDLFFECDNYKRLKLTKYQKKELNF